MNNKRNLFSVIIFQAITMLYGLILPRLIISTFGSEVNGMVSSITQFVSFISLLEGGLGAVVLAELYKPIEQQDLTRVKSILAACQSFFNKLGLIFIGYSVVLSIVYPLIIDDSRGFVYTSTLVLILSFNTLIRYLFSITNSLYLQANQKFYVVNYVSSLITILNLILAVIIIKIFPNIHVLKIIADILFLVQPFLLKKYVEKNVRVGLITKSNTYVLKNKWSGFAQNFAHFVNLNTDIAIITVFVGLKWASVYSVYMLAINALRTIVSMVSNGYQSAFGKYYASNDIGFLRNKVISFDRINTQISLILYNTCLHLLNPFVVLYTSGVTDANYYQPIFALVMVLANLFYCIREPYRYVILATGKFKETNFGAIAEAVINIALSMLLVLKYGLLGIAMGTFIAIIYRYFYFILFLRKNIIHIPIKNYFFRIIAIVLICGINIYVYVSNFIVISSVPAFIVSGFTIILVESILTICIFWVERKLSNYCKIKI